MDLLQRSSLRGYGTLFIAVFFWGASATIAKYLITTSYSTLLVVQTRSTLSFFLLAGFFLWKDRSIFAVPLRDWFKLAAVGVIGIAMTNYTYYFTVKESTVATAILIQFIAPAVVMLYMVGVAKEEAMSGRKLFALLLALAGCYLAVGGGSGADIRISGWALVTGPASMFGYAFMLIAGKKVLRRYSVWTMLVYAFGFAALAWAIVNPPWAIASLNLTLSDWGVLLLFAIISILIPHSAFAMSLKLLDASTVGIASALEPIVAIGTAAVVLGEPMTVPQLVGGFGILLSVLLLQMNPTQFNLLRGRGSHAK